MSDSTLRSAYQWARHGAPNGAARSVRRGDSFIPAARALRLARAAIAGGGAPRVFPNAHGAGTWQGGGRAVRNMGEADRGRHGRDSAMWAWHCEDASGPFNALRNAEDARPAGRSHVVGYYCDADAWESAIPVVAMLRARRGRARYVAGYRFSECDDSGVFDLSDISEADDSSEDASDAARLEAEAWAHDMAERAAERESAYRTAWQAGAMWREAAERIAEARRDALDALKARRDGLPDSALPVIRRDVSRALAEIAEARRERERLARGDSDCAPFYTGAEARAPFCEAAEIALADCPF